MYETGADRITTNAAAKRQPASLQSLSKDGKYNLLPRFARSRVLLLRWSLPIAKAFSSSNCVGIQLDGGALLLIKTEIECRQRGRCNIILPSCVR